MGKRSLWLVGSLLAALILLAWWRSTGTGTGADAQASIETDPARLQLLRFWRSFDRATELRTRGDWAGAAQLYQETLRLRPEHEESLYYLGNCRFEQGDYARAAELYRQLVQINPDSNRGQSQLGVVLSSPWPGAPLNLEEAEQAFRRCVELYPEESGAFVRLGRVALAQGRLQEAQKAFDQAAGFGSPEAVFWAGFVRFQRGEYRQAAEYFQRVLEQQSRERRMAQQGAVSEGDTVSSNPSAKTDAQPPGKGPAHLHSAATRSRVFLYWCSRRLGEYPAGIPDEFKLQPPALAGSSDWEVTAASGLDVRGLGRGAWADYDGDGDPDLAVTVAGRGVALYRNQGGALQAQAAWQSDGPENAWDLAWGDYDRDGFPDLYVASPGFTGTGRNLLLHNEGPKMGTVTFRDATPSSGLEGERATARALFLDLDGDGWLDLVEAGNAQPTGPALRLYCNRSGVEFEICNAKAGIRFEGHAVDVASGDYDGDGDLDLLVLRWKLPLILYRNQGGGRFTDSTLEAGLEGVGGDGFAGLFFDYDRDGRLDLLITEHAFYQNVLQDLFSGGSAGTTSLRLFRNRNGQEFEEVSRQAGLSSAHGVMQVAAADLNQDGWDDLIVANGSPDLSRLEPSLLLLNQRGRFKLSGYLPAFGRPANASGVAVADIHNDGRPQVYLAGAGFFQLR
ncbi:MAG: FG-GAP-like repeat-containing protein [Acidobacteriota bacterium]